MLVDLWEAQSERPLVALGAALALIPGFGQIFALGVGGAALLGYLGSRAGASIAGGVADDTSAPKPAGDDKAHEEMSHFLEVLKSGRSLVLVQTELQEVAGAASAVLNRLGLGKQAPSTSRSQSSVREGRGFMSSISVARLRSTTETPTYAKQLRP